VKARLIVALAMALTAAPGGPASGGEASDPDPPPPFFDATRQRVEYAGPGRDDPEPAGIDEVRIGYFGPSDPSHPLGGDMWLASRLAVEEANRDGGYRGIPFRLVPSWSDTPWGTGVADLARRVYSEGVWAIIGSIDGASTHLAEQVVAKARLTLINPAGTDKTVNLANVAWMFSCLPADDALARVLGSAIMDEIGRRPFVVLSTTDHDSHHAALELTTYLGREGRSPLYLMEFETGATDLSSMLERVATSDAAAVVVFADPIDSARMVSALRRLDGDLAVFGSHSMGRRAFLEAAGSDADGVVFPLPCDAAVFSSSFAAEFFSRFGRRPDCTAAQTYDTTRVTIEAIREAGLNRARIRDAIEALSPWTGVSGTIEWNSLGQNEREVRPATIDGGRIRSR
jgi:ABC-type branched-subunit amino acid transport system substrate-binding protein